MAWLLLLIAAFGSVSGLSHRACFSPLLSLPQEQSLASESLDCSIVHPCWLQPFTSFGICYFPSAATESAQIPSSAIYLPAFPLFSCRLTSWDHKVIIFPAFNLHIHIPVNLGYNTVPSNRGFISMWTHFLFPSTWGLFLQTSWILGEIVKPAGLSSHNGSAGTAM